MSFEKEQWSFYIQLVVCWERRRGIKTCESFYTVLICLRLYLDSFWNKTTNNYFLTILICHVRTVQRGRKKNIPPCRFLSKQRASVSFNKLKIYTEYTNAGIKQCQHSCFSLHTGCTKYCVLHLFSIGQWLLWNWWLNWSGNIFITESLLHFSPLPLERLS